MPTDPTPATTPRVPPERVAELCGDRSDCYPVNIPTVRAMARERLGLALDLTDARAENDRLRQRAEAAEETICLAVKLLDTDEEVHHPQPHPEILSLCAGARMTLRNFGEEVARLQQRIRELEAPPDDGC